MLANTEKKIYNIIAKLQAADADGVITITDSRIDGILKKGGRAVLLGLGVSNLPLAAFLREKYGLCGGRLTVRDIKTSDVLSARLGALPAFAGAAEEAALLVGGKDPALSLCDAPDMSDTVIFRSPGIRPDAGEIPEAVRRGAFLTSEMEWFCARTPADIFAVTGSDGKTTTTTLTYLLLKGAGRTAYVGGNIGTPLLDRADAMSRGDAAVLELSSFQLMTMNGPAKRAAITNISPNHLNWHRDMDEYTGAKYNVFGDGTELLVLNAKNPLSRAAAERFGGRVIFFTARPLPGEGFRDITRGRPGSAAVWLEGDSIVFSDGTEKREILKRSGIRLPGLHNVENYMTAAALTLGHVPDEVLRETARDFPGVEHRFELVRELDGVRYYNSSIDSSPSRTVAALSNLGCRPVVICGGRDKHVPFDSLAEALFERASAVVLTGEAAGQIRAAIDSAREKRADGGSSLTVREVPDFDGAVEAARELASPGSAVLLSPACTSFDRFANFEERGRHFKEIVNGLSPRTGAAGKGGKA